jgi:uncharacterized Rmd1/YagE family protein
MPVFCTHFQHLETRINILVQTFLADQILSERLDPTGFTPNHERLAAFRLLAHAEFEEFIESKAREGLARLSALATSTGFRLKDMHQLLAIAHYLQFDIGLTDPFDQRRYISMSKNLITTAQQKISENNGIKRKSFLMLCILFGVMPDDVDQTLLSTLDSYGSNRGDVAHRSISRVRTIQAPTDEESRVNTIVQLLKSLYDVHS